MLLHPLQVRMLSVNADHGWQLAIGACGYAG